jgi:outer membrane immunogenic protein
MPGWQCDATKIRGDVVMKRFWVSSIAAVALFSVADGAGHAADLPVKAPAAVPVAAPVVNWSGFYIGGNVGIAWSRDVFDFDTPNAGTDELCDTSTCETFHFSPVSFIGGGQIGFQSQVEKWVLGIEATWSGLDLHQTKSSVLDPTSFRSIKIDDIATVGARFGYAGVERTLIYIRAAYATARIGVHAEEGPLATQATAGAIGDWRGWRSGWNMGAGIEYMPWQNLVLGMEFNFYNFAFDTKQPILFSDGNTFQIGGSEADVFAVTARLSYLFNWGKGKAPVVAAKY